MPSFGAKLKQQREQRGVTLEEVSQSTKIGSRFLRALEEDRFEQLPGGIFNKGFVRAYARSVGLDEEETVAGYLEATEGGPANPEVPVALPEIRAEARADSSAGLPWGAFAILLLLAALAVAIWGVRNRQAAARGEPTTASPTVSQAEKAAVMANPGTARQKPSELLTDASSRTVNVRSNSASAQVVNLQIRIRQDSWISIVADGEQITRGTLPANSVRLIRAAKEVVVRAGNIGAVDFEFNGTKLPAQGQDGQAKTLIFDASGFHPAPTPPAAISGEGSDAPQ